MSACVRSAMEIAVTREFAEINQWIRNKQVSNSMILFYNQPQKFEQTDVYSRFYRGFTVDLQKNQACK